MTAQTVTSINQTPGAGITVNSPTGNVVVSAKIACVQIQSSTLGLGTGGSNTASYVAITNGSTVITIDLPSNLSNISNISITNTLSATNVVASGNTQTSNLLVTGNSSLQNTIITGNANISGNIAVNNISANNQTLAGNISANNISITNTLTTNIANVSGNLSSGNANLGNLATANFFKGDGSQLTNISVSAGSILLNGNSNITIDLNSNVRTSVNGVANVQVVSAAGVTITGVANIVGNVTANVMIANGFVGNIVTAAQPNITSLGNLTTLRVAGTSNLGPVANVLISGGTANQFLVSNGSGGLNWINATSLTTAPGSNTQVLFNDSANFAAATSVTYNKASNTLTANNFSATNVNATSGTFTTVTGSLTTNAQPNVTSVGTLTNLNVSGDTVSGNVYANAGIISAARLTGPLTTNAQPNVTSVGTLIGLGVSGNIGVDTVITSNTAYYTNANGSAILYTPGTFVVTARQNGGRIYEASHDLDSFPGLYSASFLNLSTAANVQAGMSGNGYRFIIGAGDSANRGFDLLGTSSNQLWFRSREGNPWNRALTTGDTSTNVQFNSIGVGAAANGTAGTLNATTGLFSSINVSGTGTFGNITVPAGTVSAAALSGTLTTATQTNITSVGTLNGLNVSNGIAIAGNSSPTFYINSTASNNFRTQINFSSNSVTKWQMGVDAGSTGTNNIYLYDAVASSVRMIIDPTGNVALSNSILVSGSFYDNANTAYYVKPSGTSNLNTVVATNTVTAQGYMVSMSGQGQYQLIGGSGSSWYNTMLRNDGSNFYLLTSNAYSTPSSAVNGAWNNFRPIRYQFNSGALSLNEDGVSATYLMGSNVQLKNNMYDYSDNTYYIKPSGTSVFNVANFNTINVRYGINFSASGSSIYTDASGNGPGDVVIQTLSANSTAYYTIFTKDGSLLVPNQIGTNGLVNSTNAFVNNAQQIQNDNLSMAVGKRIYVGNTGAIYDDGNFHIQGGRNGTGMWIDNSSGAILFLQAQSAGHIYLNGGGGTTYASNGITLNGGSFNGSGAGLTGTASSLSVGYATNANYSNYCGTAFNTDYNSKYGMTQLSLGTQSVGGAVLDIQQDNNSTTGALRIRANAQTGLSYVQITDQGVSSQYGYLRFNSGAQMYWSGSIAASGDITAFYSDSRLKDFEGKIENPLEKINQLSGMYYRSNQLAESFGFTNPDRQVGVIAQEIQKVLPEAVTLAPFDTESKVDGTLVSKSGENYLTVKYEKIAPLFIEAIKELNSENKELKTEVAELRTMVMDLKSIIDNLKKDK